MTHGSLFSGIGGFDLAAEWMGWTNLFHCEWNPFGQKVLKHYWPNAESFTDITKSDFTKYENAIDIISGGFPCQPYSTAGKRLGKEDERHLWPEMLRAIREVSPRYVVGENVRGLTNWNGGVVFDEVQADLEAEGYEVLPFLLPACGVGAPHRRDRIWFIAHRADPRAEGVRQGRQNTIYGPEPVAPPGGEQLQDRAPEHYRTHRAEDGAGLDHWAERFSDTWFATNPDGLIRPEGGLHAAGPKAAERHAGPLHARHVRGDWKDFPTQPPLCTGNDGLPANTHLRTIQNENSMDRDLVIKGAIDKGFLFADYEAGKVYSTRSRNRFENGMARELPGSICNGYKVHTIYFNGIKKQCRAHQIVWIAANGLYDKNKYMIDHIDRDRLNNRLSNLRLVDAKGNRDNATEYKGRLSDAERQYLLELYLQGNNSIRELADDFGISKSRVQQILTEEKQRLDTSAISFGKWRAESVKAAGNAVVPQVVYQLFKAIEQYEMMISEQELERSVASKAQSRNPKPTN